MVLTKKQFDIIDEWFENGGDETAVRKKYNISNNIWRKWLADKSFRAAVDDKIKAVQRQSQIIAAQYLPVVMAKLVQLCGSEKEEISRKACLEILALQADDRDARPSVSTDAGDEEEKTMLDEETASKILAVLAESSVKRIS